MNPTKKHDAAAASTLMDHISVINDVPTESNTSPHQSQHRPRSIRTPPSALLVNGQEGYSLLNKDSQRFFSLSSRILIHGTSLTNSDDDAFQCCL